MWRPKDYYFWRITWERITLSQTRWRALSHTSKHTITDTESWIYTETWSQKASLTLAWLWWISANQFCLVTCIVAQTIWTCPPPLPRLLSRFPQGPRAHRWWTPHMSALRFPWHTGNSWATQTQTKGESRKSPVWPRGSPDPANLTLSLHLRHVVQDIQGGHPTRLRVGAQQAANTSGQTPRLHALRDRWHIQEGSCDYRRSAVGSSVWIPPSPMDWNKLKMGRESGGLVEKKAESAGGTHCAWRPDRDTSPSSVNSIGNIRSGSLLGTRGEPLPGDTLGCGSGITSWGAGFSGWACARHDGREGQR